MNKKIGFDFTYIMDSSPTGIKKHGEEILEGLIQENNGDYQFVIFVDKDMESEYKSKFPTCKVIPVKFYLKNVRFVKRINMLKITKTIAMKRAKCDLIIYPYTNIYTAIIAKQNKIVSILDVIPLDEIKDRKSKEYDKVKKDIIKLMNKFKVVVTISEYSKKRLLEINPEYKGEVVVIPCSVKRLAKTEKKIEEVIGTNEKYIFSINSFFKHKNQITLVKAFNNIKNEIPDDLILVRKIRARFK